MMPRGTHSHEICAEGRLRCRPNQCNAAHIALHMLTDASAHLQRPQTGADSSNSDESDWKPLDLLAAKGGCRGEQSDEPACFAFWAFAMGQLIKVVRNS